MLAVVRAAWLPCLPSSPLCPARSAALLRTCALPLSLTVPLPLSLPPFPPRPLPRVSLARLRSGGACNTCGQAALARMLARVAHEQVHMYTTSPTPHRTHPLPTAAQPPALSCRRAPACLAYRLLVSSPSTCLWRPSMHAWTQGGGARRRERVVAGRCWAPSQPCQSFQPCP